MAILEKETNNYYKIDFDNCMIKGLSVIVSFAVYLTTEEREKEKTRKQPITDFINRVQQTAGEKYNSLIEQVNILGISAETDLDENGLIKAEVNEVLRALQIEINNLSSMPNQIFEHCYRYGDNIPQDIVWHTSVEDLESYGFEEEWITDPIRLSAMAQIYCDEYNGEEITYDFYYNRLKTRMNDNIEDC